MHSKAAPADISLITDNAHEADRVAYFQMVYEGFERAEQVSGPIDSYYNVAGRTIRLRFAGSALMQHLTPAFAHVNTEPTPTPDLTICIWDSVTTYTKMPLLISSLINLCQLRWFETLSPRREIIGYNSERIRTIFHYGPSILTLMDMEQNLAIYWINDAHALPYYEKGYPLTTILNWWMEVTPLQFVHAAAIGTPSGGVLLPGKSGSGKSTTALSCVESELSFLTDDTCIVTSDPQPYAYSIYNTAKLLGEEDIRRLPYLGRFVSNPDRVEGEKAMIFMHKHYPDKIVNSFPIKAILIPQITGKPETGIRKTTAGAALQALGPSTILQLPGSGRKALKLMSKLVRQIPCYVLELGTDIPKIHSTILNLLREI